MIRSTIEESSHGNHVICWTFDAISEITTRQTKYGRSHAINSIVRQGGIRRGCARCCSQNLGTLYRILYILYLKIFVFVCKRSKILRSFCKFKLTIVENFESLECFTANMEAYFEVLLHALLSNQFWSSDSTIFILLVN